MSVCDAKVLPVLLSGILLCRSLRVFSVGWIGVLAALPISEQEAVAERPSPALQQAAIDADLAYLASDELQGRGLDSNGLNLAADFIAQRFSRLGLKTDLFGDSPFQEFTIAGDYTVGDKAANWLSVQGAGVREQLEVNADFVPLSLGSNGKFRGPLVFAGYGISAKDLNYDDYANIDVSGKVVIVLRKEPQQKNASSPFEGLNNSQYAFFKVKAMNAALHKAAAMILVNDRLTAESTQEETLIEVAEAGNATGRSIPVLNCSRAVVNHWLSAASNTSLQEIEAAIDEDLKPRSFELPGFQVEGSTGVVIEQVPTKNVMAMLPGVGPNANELVIVGAHYDHVGWGGLGSLAPGIHEIHNGADDNASGVVAMLDIARQLAARSPENRRSILFIAFSGEERGLLGSEYYVNHPRFPLSDTVAMVNLDMVGRLRDNTVTVYGTGTADCFESLLTEANREIGLRLNFNAAGYGPSDHASFYGVQIPVLHFFTGLHTDYHRPSDDVEKINIAGIEQVSGVVTNTVVDLANRRERPRLIQTSSVAQIYPLSEEPESASLHYQPKDPALGVRLDINASLPVVEKVESGSAAEIAGLLQGDVILGVDDVTFTAADQLRSYVASKKVGDQVRLRVRRNSEELSITVELGSAAIFNR